MTVEKKLADALRIIAAHEVAGPLTQNDNNVSLSDLPFYVAGKAHAELAILHNIARNALDAYEARPAVTGQPRFFIDHGQIHDRVTGKHITTDEDTVFCDGINHCLALLNELARRPDGFMLATHCFECDTELHGPYCPKCAALPPQGDGLAELRAQIEALESRQRVLREALDATVALDDLLERRRTRENPEVRRIRMPDDSLAEGPVVDMFYAVLDSVKAAADRARRALAGDAG